MSTVALRAWPIKPAGLERSPAYWRWRAELSYCGRVFAVPGTGPGGLGTYASELEALRAADEYRENWIPPSAEVLEAMDRRANAPSTSAVSVAQSYEMGI